MPLPIVFNALENPVDLARKLNEISRRTPDSSIHRVVKHMIINTVEGGSVANTTAVTAFGTSKTISPGIWRPGGMLHLCAFGVFSTTGAPTIIFRVQLDSAVYVSFSTKSFANALNQSWMVEAWLVCRAIGAAGSLMPHGRVSVNTASGIDTVENVQAASALATDLSVVRTLQITGEWSAANPLNTATLKSFILEMTDF